MQRLYRSHSDSPLTSAGVSARWNTAGVVVPVVSVAAAVLALHGVLARGETAGQIGVEGRPVSSWPTITELSLHTALLAPVVREPPPASARGLFNRQPDLPDRSRSVGDYHRHRDWPCRAKPCASHHHVTIIYHSPERRRSRGRLAFRLSSSWLICFSPLLEKQAPPLLCPERHHG